MVKLEEFSINLDPTQLVFYPGQRLNGVVFINLNDDMDMKYLKIKFIGVSCCQWKDSGIAASAKDTIVSKETCLFGNLKPNLQNFNHSAGKYSYPFSFNIPSDIPSTFEDIPNEKRKKSAETFGYIRYMLKAKINKPWKFDYKVKQPIIINEFIDTNLSQYVCGPGNELREKSTSWCSCFGKKSQSDLEFTASIDRGCYCPGEPILVNAHVLNKTSSHFNSLTAELRQLIRFKASGKTKTFDIKIDELKAPKILKGTMMSWQNLPFFIPPTSLTITNCKIISVKYELRFQVQVPTGKEKLIVLPFLIGSAPRKTQYGKFIRHSKSMSPGCFNDVKFPVPVPTIFAAEDVLKTSHGETPREVVYGYCNSSQSSDVIDVTEEDDKYTWGQLKYTPLYTFVKISREIPFEYEAMIPADPKHVVNVTI